MHGLDKSAGYGEAKTGPSEDMIPLLYAMKLLKDLIDLLWRDTAALVADLQLDGAVLLPGFDAHRGFGWRIFCGVVEQVEDRLLEQDGIEIKHRQVVGDLDFNFVISQELGSALERSSDDLTDIVATGIRLDRARF